VATREETKANAERGSDPPVRFRRWLGLGEYVRAALGLVFLAALFYAPILLGLRTFPDGDFTHHFLPFSLFQRQALADLQAPLWNPYTYSGHPFWADIQAAILYPPANALLLLTLPLDNVAVRLYLLQLEAVIHVAAAGFFVFLLARELTRRFWGGLLAGVCFMLSGYLTGYPPLQLAVLRTAIWLPLLLWLLLRAWSEPRRMRFWTGAGAAFAVSFLGGHAQTCLYVAYAAAGWIIALAAGDLLGDREAETRTAWARVFGLATFAVSAAGLMAAQLLPSVEFARLSVRANVDYGYVSGGFALQDAWNLLLPGVLTQFSPLYIGVAGFGLALLGALPAFRGATALPGAWMMRYGRGYFVLLSIFGVLAGFGGNAFLYPLLYRIAPGWDLFRGQERAAFLAAFGLSMLAGYGMARLPSLEMPVRRRYALAYGALVTAGAYAFGLLWQLPGRTAVSHATYLWIAFFTLVAAMALVVSMRLDGWSGRRTWLVCGLAAVNLFVANFATNLDSGGPAAKALFAPEIEALRAALAEEASAPASVPGRVYNEFRIYEDYGMRSGIEDVWGSSPLRLSNYARLFDQFPLDRMWRLTGVRHVITWRRELFGPSELIAEFPQSADITYLHRLPDPNPRAWLAANVVLAADDEAWQLLADHGFDLGANVVLPPESSGHSGVTGRATGEVRLTRLGPNRFDVDIMDSGGGILVISENWMPGWRVRNARCGEGNPCAKGDNSPTGIERLMPLRANLAFLAVAVPEGDMRFELAYEPDSVRIGAAITGATLVMLAVAAALGTWQRSRVRRG